MKDKLNEYINSLKEEDNLEYKNQNTIIENEIKSMSSDNKTKERKLSEYKNYIKSLDKEDFRKNLNKVEYKKPNIFKRFYNFLTKNNKI